MEIISKNKMKGYAVNTYSCMCKATNESDLLEKHVMDSSLRKNILIQDSVGHQIGFINYGNSSN